MPEKIKKQPKISERDFFKFLKDKKGLLDAVVLCGGEPTLNKDLPKFMRKIKKLGFLVKLDTNGSNPQMLKEFIKKKLVDYIAMDIKAPLETKSAKRKAQNYERATGVKVDLEKIRKSIEIIKKSGIDYEFRTTCTPRILSKKDIVQIARALAPARAYFLQSFRPEKTLNSNFLDVRPYSKDFLLEIKKEISRFFQICEVR